MNAALFTYRGVFCVLTVRCILLAYCRLGTKCRLSSNETRHFFVTVIYHNQVDLQTKIRELVTMQS